MIDIIRKRFQKSEGVFKNIGLLALGEALGRILGIVTLPIITRIYDPVDLGVLSLFNSWILILIPFGTLKYSNAIVLPKSKEYAFNITFLSFLLNFLFSAILAVVLFFYGKVLFTAFGAGQISSFWYLICIAVFLVNVYDVFYNWALRKNDYKLITKTKPIQTVIGEGSKIVLGLLNVKPLGLVIGSILSRSGGIVTLSRAYRSDYLLLKDSVSFTRIKFLSRFYWDFPTFRLSSFFLFTLSTQLIPIIITFLYGTYSNGQVGLALIVLALPISLIGQSISQVYYNEIAKIKNYRTNELYDFTHKIAKKLVVFSVIPFLAILLFSEFMFSVFFGAEWELAGRYSSILSFFLLTQFIASPLMNVFIIIKKQHKTLLIHALRLSLILIISLVAWKFELSIDAFLSIYSVVLSFHYAFVIFNLFDTIKRLRNDKI